MSNLSVNEEIAKIKGVMLDDSERQPCEVWTRVMGYHRPKESFNRGKKAEFDERVNFTEAKAVSHLEEGLANDKK